MTTYKLIKKFIGMSMFSGETAISGVIKTEESGRVWHIPLDPDNSDYQEYLRWVDAGNTPEPADEPQGAK